MTTNELLYALKTVSDRLNEPCTEITIELRKFGIVVVGGVSQAVLDDVMPMLPLGARLERKLA